MEDLGLVKQFGAVTSPSMKLPVAQSTLSNACGARRLFESSEDGGGAPDRFFKNNVRIFVSVF